VSLGVTLLVLFAAAMHAIWNAIVKASEDSLVQLATLNVATALIAAALLPVAGLPGWASAPYLAGNAACQSAYYAFLLNSYSAGGLSLVYPIARGSAPLLVALASAFFLGETLSGKHLLGVGVITASILSLAFSGGRAEGRARAISLSPPARASPPIPSSTAPGLEPPRARSLTSWLSSSSTACSSSLLSECAGAESRSRGCARSGRGAPSPAHSPSGLMGSPSGR
jgi:drug/metabolite transporter (DMT)-like permease